MKKIICALLVLSMMVAFAIPSTAASVGVSTSSLTIEKGKSATFSISASDAQAWATVSSSNSSIASTNISDAVWVENSSSAVTVTGNSVGTTTIVVSFPEAASADGEQNLSGATRTVTINVVEPATQGTTKPKETTTASSNANLKSMSVEGYTLSPAFNQWTTEYTIIVPKDTKSINLSATPLNANCSVSGTGALSISKLPQTFSIVCKAPNGETKTYHLTVKAPTEIGLTSLEIYALANLDPAFDPGIFEYTAIVPYGTKAVYVKAPFDEENFKDAKIKIEGADDLKASKDTVTITITAADGTETVYTIHIEYEDEIVDAVTETVERNRIPLWIVIIFLLLIIAFSIVCFFLGRRYERSQHEAYKKYYHADDDNDYDNNDDGDGPSIFGGFDQSAD